MRPGRFCHDDRFQTLLDEVNICNQRLGLGMADQKTRDVLKCLKSL